ncbi:MAG: EAL domain-containing protein [Xanthomonadaceae bacterium]|nr:EAL domain-containing protein [Xanthomonadaceae bacterium]
MHRLLDRQVREATRPDGELDLAKLLSAVEQTYARAEDERRGIVRSMQLMSEEATALTKELKESTASQLQAVLDHVKDVIMTIDGEGHIASLNMTGQRVFGHTEAEAIGRPLNFLLPRLAGDQPICEVLDQLAARLEDTQVDLSAHETFGQHANGSLFAAEMAVSKTTLNRRTAYVVCLRDTTERKRAELMAAGERRVFERLAANLDLPIALEAITSIVEQVAPESTCAIRMLDPAGEHLRHCAGPNLPSAYVAAMEGIKVDARNGSCAAAVFLQRQVIVADTGRDALWENCRDAVRAAGFVSAWSTLIYASDGRVLGTLALYFRSSRSPCRRDFELMARMTQLAGIAIERRLAENALRASEARYRRLFDNVLEGVYSSTKDGKFVSVNPALARMVGLSSPDELLSMPTSTIYHFPEDREKIIAALDRDGEVRSAEFQLRRVDGTLLTVLESARAVRNEQGEVIGYEGTISDISERKRAETAIFEEKEKAQVTLESIGDAVITTDAEGRIEYLNPIAEELTGWETGEVSGKPLLEVFTVLNEATREPLEDPVSRSLRDGRVVADADHTVLVNRRGQEIAIQDSAAPIRDRAGQIIGFVIVFHDVSKERRLRRALAYQASHDVLTGLINRREFENRLNEALLTARSDESVAHVLLYLDLDQFKVVNDTCGHQAGDRLLKEITGILQTRVRAKDTIARLGGDEFGILLQDCTADRAEKIADVLRQAIREYRFEWHDGAMNVGASIGIVEINSTSESITSVMSAADVACYAAKDSGRNRVHMYQHGAAPERHREMQWVSRLTRACEENRLELYYQPIVPIGANRDTRGHYELLLRMRGENGELVQPAEFIPAAERYNVMPMIDRWVVSQALGALAHYRADGDPRHGYTLSINLSGTSLNDDRFLDFLINELQTHDLSPGAVCFEITETAAISNLPNVVHFMREFRSRGCQFSLDDFGSGLSSFMYLKNLPVDYLKIDGQFIQHVTTDHVDRSMVEAITQIGHAMGIKTIAERVETAEVLACLAEIGVEYAQGIYIAVPQSVESLNRITRTSPHPKLRLVHSA